MNNQIHTIPNIEKDKFAGALQAISRNADSVAVAMKIMTDALIKVGYEKDDALVLTLGIFKDNDLTAK